MMNVLRPRELPDLAVIEPIVYDDPRGFLLETWHLLRYLDVGIPGSFVQDVHSHSRWNVLRGMHFQHPNPQGKLVRVPRGRVIDVAVDVRRGSPTFGRWWGLELSEDNRRQLWIPPGFAHGYLTMSGVADFEYRCTDYYSPESSHSLAWDDPVVDIDWPVADPILSEADSRALTLSELEKRGHLPEYEP